MKVDIARMSQMYENQICYMVFVLTSYFTNFINQSRQSYNRVIVIR